MLTSSFLLGIVETVGDQLKGLNLTAEAESDDSRRARLLGTVFKNLENVKSFEIAKGENFCTVMASSSRRSYLSVGSSSPDYSNAISGFD